MLYNSWTYAVFLSCVFGLYWALRRNEHRLLVLIVASWAFYAAWHPIYLTLLLSISVGTWRGGLLIDRSREIRPRTARAALVSCIVLALGLLAWYKYSGFGCTTARGLLRYAGAGAAWSCPTPFLPLGISFITFQAIAYIVDVWRRDCEPVQRLRDVLLFKAFFPQLIAGPIVRANELIEQFRTSRVLTGQRFLRGTDLIARGVFKKAVIADAFAPMVDAIFSAPSTFGSATLILGAYAYAIQIYCDFSGYTDIGRGSATLLGYELPENFQFPYMARTLTEFWRRWHMSLSRWLRDYLYIPLGGSRVGPARTRVNLMATMLLGGLWHGANWTFVAWGGLHGAVLALSPRGNAGGSLPVSRAAAILGATLQTFVTFNVVCVAWILFRSPTFGVAREYFAGILGNSPILTHDVARFGYVTLALAGVSIVVLAAVEYALSRGLLGGGEPGRLDRLSVAVRPVWYAIVALAALTMGGGSRAFIYFQF